MVPLLRIVLGLWWNMLLDVVDTFLVWAGYKHWPATGRAQWNRPPGPVDERARAWQDYLGQTLTGVANARNTPTPPGVSPGDMQTPPTDPLDPAGDRARAVVARLRAKCALAFDDPPDHAFFSLGYLPGETPDQALFRIFEAEQRASGMDDDAVMEALIHG